MPDIPVDPRFADEIQSDPAKLQQLLAVHGSFREFLKLWKYLNQETGEVLELGADLWDSQEEACEAVMNADRLFFLKARKLGLTTICVAYCGWACRFRDANARVHIFSRRTEAAAEALAAVVFGLNRLPDWMRLPSSKDNQLEYVMEAGPDDRRMLHAYPTSEETAVEATATHAFVDELARMRNPRLVWQAIEPSFAGSAHIATTGRGPVNYASNLYRKCLSGDSDFIPIFIDALARRDRDEKWMEKKRRSMTKQAFRQEYPMTYQDAMAGGGKYMFAAETVDLAGNGLGSAEAIEGHRYVKAWDIGRHKDAAVGLVIDVDSTPLEVVEYVRLRNTPYPVLQNRIEDVHGRFRGKTRIEANGPGEAVAENLNISMSEVELFKTTGQSKPRIIENTQLTLERRGVRWSATEWPQLDEEVRGYQVPDDNIVQDSVMTLAMALDGVNAALGRAGKVHEPILV